MEKLWIHGGAIVDPEENISIGKSGWEQRYLDQLKYKQRRLNRMLQYTNTPVCRMLQLVQYFGDQEDDGTSCGQCDICSPDSCLALNLRQPNSEEQLQLMRILETLRTQDHQASGKLYTHKFQHAIDRRSFEALVNALCSAGLIEISEESFEKEGRRIEFRRCHLTQLAKDEEQVQRIIQVSLKLRERLVNGKGRPTQAKKRVKTRRKGASKRLVKPEPNRQPAAESARVPVSIEMLSALKAWRLQKARRFRIPAFRVLTDRVLTEIATSRPTDPEQLLAISGIGPKLLEKYGEEILQIVVRTQGK